MSKANELKDDLEELWREFSQLRQEVDALTSRLVQVESLAADVLARASGNAAPDTTTNE